MKNINEQGAIGPIDPRSQPTGRQQDSALTQPTWYVNAITGDDRKSGATSATAVKTLNEVLQRIGIGKLQQYTTVYIETDLDEPEGYAFNGDYTNVLNLIGTRTVIDTGTLTAVQVYNDALVPGQDGQITDAALPVSWTDSGYFDKLLVMTAGANAGATAWIVKDLGAKTARFSPMLSNAFAIVDPTTDDYEVVDLSRIDEPCYFQHRGTLLLDDLNLNGNAAAFLYTYVHSSGTIGTWCCRIGGYATVQNGAAETGQHYGSLLDNEGGTYQLRHGISELSGCAAHTTVRTASRSANLWVVGDSILQVKSSPVNLELRFGGTSVVYANVFIAGFDNVTASQPLIEVESGGQFELQGKAWGLNWDNNGYGIWVDSDGVVLYPDPDNFTLHADVDGAGITEVRVGGVNSTYVAVGVPGLTTASRMCGIIPYENNP